MPDTPNGWIGTASELYHALRMFGCDTNADGKFCVDGNITSFMGAGDEFVVGGDAVFYVSGQPRNLAGALHSTGYGRAVNVI
jgi:hypothetical protein